MTLRFSSYSRKQTPNTGNWTRFDLQNDFLKWSVLTSMFASYLQNSTMGITPLKTKMTLKNTHVQQKIHLQMLDVHCHVSFLKSIYHDLRHVCWCPWYASRIQSWDEKPWKKTLLQKNLLDQIPQKKTGTIEGNSSGQIEHNINIDT